MTKPAMTNSLAIDRLLCVLQGQRFQGVHMRSSFASYARPAHRAFGIILSRTILLCAALTCAAFVTAEESPRPSGVQRFNIPAEPLIEALQTYSKTTDIQVMFETSSAEGYLSTLVAGEFLPETALQMLLAGTDLRVRYTRSNVITLAPASALDADQPPVHPLALTKPDMALDTLLVSGPPEHPDQAQLDAYISTVQSDIQKALKKSVRTGKNIDYRLGIKLWIDASRTVQKAELFQSTGNQESDTQVASALQGLTLSHTAPPKTPQPIRFMIEIRTF